MEVRRMLRQSLATHETASVLQMLKEHNPTSTSIRFNLQMIGDALLLALRQDASASSELAIACIDGLCERSWRGDYELNLQLRIGIGIDPAPLLRPLSVDLDELADVMEGDPLHAGGVVNLETGLAFLCRRVLGRKR